MNKLDYKKIYAIKKENERRIRTLVPDIKETSGIYCFYRTDENGIKHAYIGKAETNILERLASHLSGYSSHIDKSIKKYHLYNAEKYPLGYKIKIVCYCPASQCDELERKYIKICADAGYQMKNTETGGTTGKSLMNERQEPKGYLQGVRNGKKQLAKELKHIIDLHLVVELKPDKTNNKVSIKQLEKFNNILKELTEEP